MFSSNIVILDTVKTRSIFFEVVLYTNSTNTTNYHMLQLQNPQIGASDSFEG